MKNFTISNSQSNILANYDTSVKDDVHNACEVDSCCTLVLLYHNLIIINGF